MRRTVAPAATSRLNALSLLSEVAASATEADAPPPSPLEVPLLWPALLLVLAALFGGLRALLQSPVRAHLLAGLDEAYRAKVDRLLERRPWAGSAAGLARVFAVTGAVALLFQETRGLDPTSKIWVWASAALCAGLLLEGLPSLVTRRRARRLVLVLLPITGLLAITYIIGQRVSRASGGTVKLRLKILYSCIRCTLLGEAKNVFIGIKHTLFVINN